MLPSGQIFAKLTSVILLVKRSVVERGILEGTSVTRGLITSHRALMKLDREDFLRSWRILYQHAPLVASDQGFSGSRVNILLPAIEEKFTMYKAALQSR